MKTALDFYARGKQKEALSNPGGVSFPENQKTERNLFRKCLWKKN